ncbi:YqgQ family protein [Bacillus sp. OVS6]|nr:YqgQ family protein [Bacillus sp. OVS6]
MKTIYDIQQLLKKYGTIIYIGDRSADLELMEMEVRQLFDSNLIEVQDYQMAVLLLRQEGQRVRKKVKANRSMNCASGFLE